MSLTEWLESQATILRSTNDKSWHYSGRASELALADLIDGMLRRHQPKDDGPFSMVSWTYCACGQMTSRVMPDGYSSIAPAPYPCGDLLDLTTYVAAITGNTPPD